MERCGKGGGAGSAATEFSRAIDAHPEHAEEEVAVAFNYANSKATADRLLTQFGRAVTLRRVVQGAYNDDASTVALTTTDVAAMGVLLGFNDRERAGNPAILAQDRKALVAVGALASPPVVGDRLVVDGAEWQVIGASALSPAGTDLLYTLQIRR